jgi:hypothetical protein
VTAADVATETTTDPRHTRPRSLAVSHRRTTALAALALLVTACGTQPKVQLEVAPAAAIEKLTPVAEEAAVEAPVVEEVVEVAEQVAEPASEPKVTAPEPAPAPAPAPAPRATSTPEPKATATPEPTASATPAPPSDPELVVGEDGCVTDVTLGIVITCNDPAAGPDED